MSSEWIDTTIGDQVQLQRGVDITKRDFKQGTIPVVSSGGIGGFHDTFTGVAPGVILGRKGLVGSVYYLPTDYWAHDTTLWVKDFKGNHPKYVYYFFRSIAATLRDLDVGSANPTLNRNHVHPIETRWAPIDEQKAIAHILGTLDDKIELNRKTNETLEAMAKALFKSWFVDFDPVRAKAEGRPTGLPAEISDLFPDSFEDSELGEIPSGWKVKSLDKVAHFLNGLALQKFPPEDGAPTLPVIKIAQLKKGDSIGADRCSTAVPSDYVVRDGDMLFSWSGSLAVDIWCGGDGALNQHLFKVTSKTYGKWFFYQWVKHHLPEFQEIAQGKATTMGHIQRHHLSEAMALIPKPSLLAAMDSAFAPLLDRAFGLRKQSNDLATTRDALLPKLISGELRIPDAEKMLEEVGV
jgi:type I restriction enzyme S subunit